MRIAIFGGTSGTGAHLVDRCVDAGHEVTALVRDAARFPAKGSQLAARGDWAARVRLVVGDARDAGAVAETVKGADAVFSTLGPKSPFAKSDLLERAVPAIVRAMDAAGVRRLIVLGAGGWQPGALKKQGAVRRAVFKLVGKTLLKKPIEWQQAQERAVRASDLEWTIVAPPRLVNSKAKGRYRVDGEALPKNAAQIARADLAEFMFFELEDREWVRKIVYVAW